MSVEPKLIAVDARVLPPPTLEYGPRDRFLPQNGKWNILRREFKSVNKIKTWAILKVYIKKGNYMDRNVKDPAFRKIDNSVIQALTNAIQLSGLGEKAPTTIEMALTGEQCPEQDNINDAIIRSTILANYQAFELFFVILSNQDQFIYSRIKYYADLLAGRHTVCAVATKISSAKRLADMFANIAHKINLKLGGVNHALLPQDMGILQGGTTMLVGVDVAHPSPASIREAPSIAGKCNPYIGSGNCY